MKARVRGDSPNRRTRGPANARTRGFGKIRCAATAIGIALIWVTMVEQKGESANGQASGGSLAVMLPEGDGKALVQRACGGCHDPSLVMFSRQDEEGWAAIVNDMAARGAKGAQKELEVITAYLAEHFNRERKFSPLEGLGAAADARDERELFTAGKEIYQKVCAGCHNADGQGRDKIAPPLVGSPLTLAPPAIAVRVMLHGKRGPTNIMPAVGSLMSDPQIAAVLTYVRREWGNTASAIDAKIVQDIRSQTAGRARPWSAEELWKLAK